MSKLVPLEDLARQVHALKARIGRNIYELGRLLVLIKDDERYVEAGFDSFSEYLDQVLDLSRTAAYRAMSIYRHFSPELARRYGVAKLEAGLAYMRATPEQERPGDLLAASLRLRGARGRFVTRSFHEATVTEIHEATQLVRAADSGRRHGISARLRKRVDALAEQLPDAPARFRRGQGIRLRRDRESGRLFATFTAVPLDSVDAMIELLKELRDTVE